MTSKKDIIKYSELLVHYKNLFTNKQLAYLIDYFMNDLSFNEIAIKYHVSAMAIADSVKHSKKALVEYETKLHLHSLSLKRNTLYQKIKDVKLRKKIIAIDNI